MLVAMKSEIPDPKPYPFWRSSSRQITIIPAKHSWRIIRIAFPTPSWPTLPYIPERTYATASPTAIKIPNNFWAPFLKSKVNKKNIINYSNTQQSRKSKPAQIKTNCIRNKLDHSIIYHPNKSLHYKNTIDQHFNT